MLIIQRRLAIIAAIGSVALTVLLLAMPATGGGRPPAVDELAALSNPGTESVSAVPPHLATLMSHLSDPNAAHGEAVATQVKELLHGQGRGSADVYGYPTTTGAVCVMVSERIDVGTCADHFDRDTLPVLADAYYEAGSTPSIAGLAPGNVVEVDVVVNGAPQPSTLAKNAFYYQSPPGTDNGAISAIVVRYRDGTSTTQPFSTGLGQLVR